MLAQASITQPRQMSALAHATVGDPDAPSSMPGASMDRPRSSARSRGHGRPANTCVAQGKAVEASRQKRCTPALSRAMIAGNSRAVPAGWPQRPSKYVIVTSLHADFVLKPRHSSRSDSTNALTGRSCARGGDRGSESRTILVDLLIPSCSNRKVPCDVQSSAMCSLARSRQNRAIKSTAASSP